MDHYSNNNNDDNNNNKNNNNNNNNKQMRIQCFSIEKLIFNRKILNLTKSGIDVKRSSRTYLNFTYIFL